MSNSKLSCARFAVSAFVVAMGASLSLAPALAATVSIYKVTDADGRVTYHNIEPKGESGRIEKKAFDLEANAMNFTQPRATGRAPSGGSGVNNNDIATRLVDELSRRTTTNDTGMSISRGSRAVVFNNQLNSGTASGGGIGGIVTPTGTLIGGDNAAVGGNNAGGGTGMGGGQGTGPAIVNPSTGSATFSATNPTFTGNSPTFTSNSATFSSNTGTLGPATPGVGAGTTGGTANTFNSTGSNAGASVTTPQTGIAPGTNPFTGTGNATSRATR